jgi:uncharacterized protein YchJ
VGTFTTTTKGWCNQNLWKKMETRIMKPPSLGMMAAAAISASASVQGFSNAFEAAQNRNFKGIKNVVGQTPRIPKQKRNEPCGCGSGLKAKKCCGEYVK